jgi:hypothetical protein
MLRSEQMPGGGFGIFDDCTTEWGTPSTGWGAKDGGISTCSQCDAFAAALQSGCYWRFDWFEDANNPTVLFEQVERPLALMSKSGGVRANDAIDECRRVRVSLRQFLRLRQGVRHL